MAIRKAVTAAAVITTPIANATAATATLPPTRLCDPGVRLGTSCVAEGFDYGRLACAASCDAYSLSACQYWDWQTMEHPGPLLAALWGTSTRNVYAAGVLGTIRHLNGNKWLRIELNTFTTLYQLCGSGPGNIL